MATVKSENAPSTSEGMELFERYLTLLGGFSHYRGCFDRAVCASYSSSFIAL